MVENTELKPQPSAPRVFGRFELLLEMAWGGMATLYLARLRGPQHFQKMLVVKRIHEHCAKDDQFIQMFLDEARITAMIHHPNVASVFDMGQHGGQYYLAMEYIHGEDLTAVLRAAKRTDGSIPWSFVARIIADAAAGLHAAHELSTPDGKPLGIVHRDVSPHNILISYEGHVKIIDFGVAYAAERLTHTTTGTMKGKAAYMSPEQITVRHVDRRSDVFSLGTVLFESLCLKRLFREDNEAATLLKVRDAEVPSPRSINPEIPVELEEIVYRALKKNPDERYPSAAAMEEDLEKLLASKGEFIGHQQLTGFMKRLFHDKRKIKDEQIQQALEQEASMPAKAVGMVSTKDGASSSTALEVGAAVSRRRNARRTFLSWVVGGLVMVALIVVGVVVFGSRGGMPQFYQANSGANRGPTMVGEDQDASKSGAVVKVQVETLTPLRRAADKVSVKVSIYPRRANPTVKFRGEVFNSREFVARIERSKETIQMVVEAPGFEKQLVELTPERDLSKEVNLKPLRDFSSMGGNQGMRGSSNPMEMKPDISQIKLPGL